MGIFIGSPGERGIGLRGERGYRCPRSQLFAVLFATFLLLITWFLASTIVIVLAIRAPLLDDHAVDDGPPSADPPNDASMNHCPEGSGGPNAGTGMQPVAAETEHRGEPG